MERAIANLDFKSSPCRIITQHHCHMVPLKRLVFDHCVSDRSEEGGLWRWWNTLDVDVFLDHCGGACVPSLQMFDVFVEENRDGGRDRHEAKHAGISKSRHDQPFSRPIGASRRQAACLLLRKLLELFWQKLSVIRKIGQFTFKMVGINQAPVFLSYS
jgi:hypothetical protein